MHDHGVGSFVVLRPGSVKSSMIHIALQRVVHRPSLCYWDDPRLFDELILLCCCIIIEFMTVLSSLSITTMLLA